MAQLGDEIHRQVMPVKFGRGVQQMHLQQQLVSTHSGALTQIGNGGMACAAFKVMSPDGKNTA